jgi:bacillithiol biosynthesis cysteine-adding enzyme BshC
MQKNPAKLHNHSQLMADYRNQKGNIMDFFDYRPFEDYEKRVADLTNREFDRKGLSEVLMKMNQQWDAPASTQNNIYRLQEESSTVVIGGQQAGLLTGPLYTINKVISIIQFAKQQEEKLNRPVIPVFWIAGEDHDFEEINHVYLPSAKQMKKFKLDTAWNNKQPVSELSFNAELCRQWIDELFENLEETNYTKELYDRLVSTVNQSESYTAFFARLLFDLFADEGVVLIDSAHKEVRRLESDYFIQLIEKQSEISEGVYRSLEELKNQGYAVSLEADPNDGHLFYHYHGERILLIRDEEGNWRGKQGECLLSNEELLQIAKDQPELLSNNVATRPLMQELLFPTLAFIGGPGEVAYWAALHRAFSAIGIKMPPVMPRLSITYVDRQTEKNAKKFNLPLEQLVNQGVGEFRNDWLSAKTKPPISELASDVRRAIDEAHKPLRELANEIRSDIADLSEKNLFYLFRDIEFLERKMNQAVEEKYKQELEMLDGLELVLRPEGGLQERMWNPLPLVNKQGLDWLKEVLKQPFSFEEEHYFIYL